MFLVILSISSVWFTLFLFFSENCFTKWVRKAPEPQVGSKIDVLSSQSYFDFSIVKSTSQSRGIVFA